MLASLIAEYLKKIKSECQIVYSSWPAVKSKKKERNLQTNNKKYLYLLLLGLQQSHQLAMKRNMCLEEWAHSNQGNVPSGS